LFIFHPGSNLHKRDIITLLKKLRYIFIGNLCAGKRKSQWVLNKLSERAKLGLLCFLLILAMGFLVLTAVNTVQAVRSFQQQDSALEAGDVKTVHAWMTVHVISHIYNVPEVYLEHSLQINNSPDLIRHATLNQLASRKRQPVSQVIRTVQTAILVYRKQHPHPTTPTTTPTPRPGAKAHSPTAGRPY
jgi:hypothetical protein